MLKFALLTFLAVFFVLPITLYSQSLDERENHPAIEGHARGSSSGPNASEAIKNERKTLGSSIFNFEWLFGTRLESRAARISQSERLDAREPYVPPRSESQPVTAFRSRTRRQVNFTTNANFIKNEPTEALEPSRRDQQLAIGSWDLGVLFGTSHSVTDIQNNKSLGFGDFIDYQISNFNYTFGVFTRYKAADWFAINGGMKYAYFSGSNEPPADFQYESFSFENDLFEFFIKTEFYAPILQYSPSELYLFTGITLFFSDVKVLNADGMIHTITDEFQQIQPAMPFGLGYSYTFNNDLSVGYEFGWRYTLFYYLDGVRVENQGYDSYFFNMITVSYPLSTN